ncbi:MAG: nitroreductase family protein [Thomasclavelia ramosa]
MEKIIEAGRYAPSGNNNQTCHFIVITNKEFNEIKNLVQEEFSKMEIVDGMYQSIINSINNAKKAIMYFIIMHRYLLSWLIKRLWKVMADCSCALENMMLEANELELGSCWINQLRWLDENPRINEYLKTLGLLDDEIVCGSLSVGYVEKLNRTITKRTGNVVTFIK